MLCRKVIIHMTLHLFSKKLYLWFKKVMIPKTDTVFILHQNEAKVVGGFGGPVHSVQPCWLPYVKIL